MNAPFSPRDLRERLLASHILEGDGSKIPDAEGYYTFEEWRQAAQIAADNDDFGDLRFMTRQAELYTDYRNATGGTDYQGDFGDWLEGRV